MEGGGGDPGAARGGGEAGGVEGGLGVLAEARRGVRGGVGAGAWRAIHLTRVRAAREEVAGVAEGLEVEGGLEGAAQEGLGPSGVPP